VRFQMYESIQGLLYVCACVRVCVRARVFNCMNLYKVFCMCMCMYVCACVCARAHVFSIA